MFNVSATFETMLTIGGGIVVGGFIVGLFRTGVEVAGSPRRSGEESLAPLGWVLMGAAALLAFWLVFIHTGVVVLS